MAFLYFDSKYAPCGFLIVSDNASPYDDDSTCLIQTDCDFPSVASRIGWQPCDECCSTDGTIDCEHRTASDMIDEAYDFLVDHDGESFDALDEYIK